MIIIILGPPGSGKGTQSKIIANKFNLIQIATGDIFRDAVIKHTKLGELANTYMKKGELVPDSVVIGIVKEKIDEVKDNFILDGFPRSESQARALDSILSGSNRKIDFCLNLMVNKQILLTRLTGRRICATCKQEYHIKFKPTRNKNICDICNVEIKQREDDKETAIVKRLLIFNKECKPVIEYYKKQNILNDINGNDDFDKVTKQIFDIIEKNDCNKNSR